MSPYENLTCVKACEVRLGNKKTEIQKYKNCSEIKRKLSNENYQTKI